MAARQARCVAELQRAVAGEVRKGGVVLLEVPESLDDGAAAVSEGVAFLTAIASGARVVVV